MRVLLVRHGRTEWNERRLVQGHTDVPLGARGRAELAGRRVPRECAGWPCYSSPLARAVETARLLGVATPRLDVRLREMGYGAWEGRDLAAVRAEDPPALAANEARGLDFRPPGGESPREVQARVRQWLAETAVREAAVIAVTHKALMTATLAFALDWDYRGRPPRRLDWTRGHLFAFDVATGNLCVERLGVALE